MQTKNPPKRGRSPGYTTEIAETICNRLVNRESLRAICADPAMLSKATLCRWLAGNQEFRRWYAFARRCQVEDFAFEILAIADDSSRDYMKKAGVDGIRGLWHWRG
jgi:predicted nucleic acid-binding protein